MTDLSCSLLSAAPDDEEREWTLADYEAAAARWCPGCGDHAILTGVERLLEAEQLPPEQTVFVSGIGCASRFPHYLHTYGFHGIHGRALPIATGIKLRRPELHVFVVMGDGDCCSIGAGHWIHAVRYNLDIVALLLDNGVYGLTKNQTSPPINPIAATLGVTNASFVAQTGDWLPAHLYATLQAAFHHHGLAFVRVLQRCPQYTPAIYDVAMRDPDLVELLVHPNGVVVPELDRLFKHKRPHDPADLDAARHLAEPDGKIRLGVFYRNETCPVYEETRAVAARSASEKVALLGAELDRYAV